MSKICSRCKQEKPLSEFRKAKGYKDGIYCWCSPCHTLQVQEWRAKKSPEYMREVYLRNEYGISLEEYALMFEAQLGLCAICGQPEPRDDGNLCVDHNHATGEVRGLLCHNCNKSLGLMNDDYTRLRAAAYYLKYFKTGDATPAQIYGIIK